MRELRKGAEPQSFADWKLLENEGWQPFYKDLANPQKRELLEALVIEQGFRCCYCGASIDTEGAHIEHFRPQERYEGLELDYSNLHASCLRELARSTPLRCGHAKGSWFDEESHISPQSPGCERRFRYLLDGTIFPAEEHDLAAASMIGALALNIAFLENARADVLLGVFDDEFLATASAGELQKIIDTWALPGEGGRQSSMCHVVVRFADQLLNTPGS